MKKQIISLSTLLFVCSIQAQTHLDMNKGTVLHCQESSELGQVAFSAEIQQISKSDEAVVLKITPRISVCSVNSQGRMELLPYGSELLKSQGGLIRYQDFKLMVSSTDGQLIQETFLKAGNSEIVTVSLVQMEKLPDGLIEVGARAEQTLIFPDRSEDSRNVFFGSYLTRAQAME